MQTISLWYTVTLKYLTWYLCADLEKKSAINVDLEIQLKRHYSISGKQEELSLDLRNLHLCKVWDMHIPYITAYRKYLE